MVFVFLFHLFGLIESVWALNVRYIYVQSNPSVKRGFGGEWQFLTYINLYVQLVMFTLCVLQDILSISNKTTHMISRMVRNIKDLFYISLAFPLCLFVVSTFWFIFAIDRELIAPVNVDIIVPFWTNHVFHSCILVTLLISYFDNLQYPSRKKGMLTSAVFFITYIAWITFIFIKSGSWPYPFLNMLPPVMLFSFFAISFLVLMLYYALGEYIYQNFRMLGKKTGSSQRKKKLK